MRLAPVANNLVSRAVSYAETPNDDDVISYLGLRKAVGIIGIALPFVLVLGNILLWDGGFASSISAYYYTEMRDIFVGSLCAIGIFLMSYRGPERQDDIAGDLACVFALCVALFPTTADGQPTSLSGVLHLASAAGLFLTLAFFCLKLFPKTKPGSTPTASKRRRQQVYIACGWIILACIALIVFAANLPGDSAVKRMNPVLWLESLAVFAFGWSWLVKGLKDKDKETSAVRERGAIDMDDTEELSTRA